MTPQETRDAIISRINEEFIDGCEIRDLSEFPNKYGDDRVNVLVRHRFSSDWYTDLPISIGYSYTPPRAFFIPRTEQENNEFTYQGIDHLFEWMRKHRREFFKPKRKS
jgi:hypothetical protein